MPAAVSSAAATGTLATAAATTAAALTIADAACHSTEHPAVAAASTQPISPRAHDRGARGLPAQCARALHGSAEWPCWRAVEAAARL